MNLFHFAQYEWLWLLGALPVWWGWLIVRRVGRKTGVEVADYADAHLMPYLTVQQRGVDMPKQARYWPYLLQVAWVMVVLAMAGPRWDFLEQQVLTPDSAVMLVVDVSHSMRVNDIAPDRAARARQEILEFLDAAKPLGVRVGIVAFAAQAHLVTPLSEDVGIVREFVPALTPDLVSIQGSDPYQAIEFAAAQLERYETLTGGESRHIVLITDGDMHDVKALESQARSMSQLSPPMQLHIMTLGTEKGGAVHDGQGNWMRDPDTNQPHISRLQPTDMQRIADAGAGQWVQASWLQDDTDALLAMIAPKEGQVTQSRMERLWNERFVWPLMVGMLLLVVASRRAGVVAVLLCLAMPSAMAEPLRQEMEGIQSFHDGDYDAAAEHFHHPYRKGVAHYRAGNYADATKAFADAINAEKNSEQPNAERLAGAWHNLGNSLFYEKNYEKALKSYENALKINEEHAASEVNRDLLRKLLQKPPESSAQPQANKDSPEDGKPEKQDGASDGESEDQSQGGDGENESENNDPSEQGEQEGDSDSENEGDDEEGESDQSGSEPDKPESEGEQSDGDAQGDEESDEPEGDAGADAQDETQDDAQDSKPEEAQGEPAEHNPMADRLLDQLSGDASDLLERRIDAQEKKDGRRNARDIRPW